MQQHSRRDFLQSCLYWSLLGSCPGISALLGGCKREKQQKAFPDLLKDTEKEPGIPRRPASVDLNFEPPYVRLQRSDELKKRGEALWNMMEKCSLCPRQCGTNRLKGDEGFCRASSQLEISAYHPHYGEERPLVGKGGSGAIFLTNCGLRCVFCINWEVSHEGRGRAESIDYLSEIMLKLQERGCHNINVVTPTHYSPHIVLALDRAAEKGLRLPLVYNTCGWERAEVLKLLDGVVDIYLPDFKYADGNMAARYSAGAENYPEVTKTALLEMHRQVGVAKPAVDGLMYRGLMIRHLVMPNNVGGTKEVIFWIADNLPRNTYLNIMSQYTPVYKASEYPKISRRITMQEYRDAVRWAREAGLTNLDIQGFRLL